MRQCARTYATALLIAMGMFIAPLTIAGNSVSIDGEARKWHRLVLTFDGPDVSESDEANPFTDYRFDVVFTHLASQKQYRVPGFFAADGDAANTGATEGNKWRALFRPDEVGEWQWQASFRKGRYVAISKREFGGYDGGFMNGQSGRFKVKKSNKKAPDFRALGRLQYVNQPYLRFAEDGSYFIKAGPDSPENLLSFADFDGSFHDDGHKDELVKTWEPHVKDWQKGDPNWQDGKGKGLIGALNYIASKGMNSISFLTLNILGDDQNVFPYVDYTTLDRFDVSKLAQWEMTFNHAQNLGLFLHFKTQEVENQGLLDNGGMGLERKLYYRELIARFGHHLALNWNMGEENGDWYPANVTPAQSTSERIAMARFFYENDPYHHHIVIHNGVYYDDLRGADSYYTGASVQTNQADFSSIHGAVKKLREWPVANGRPWAIAVDEPGDAQFALVPDTIDAEHNNARMNGLWGALTAGAWGTEWYFGYKHPHSDLNAEDWRTRDAFWDQARHAIEFFKLIDVPLSEAKNSDQRVSNAWALAKDAEFYIVYTKNASKETQLSLPGGIANYRVQWFNPRDGGGLQDGSIKVIEQKAEFDQPWIRHKMAIGLPPSSANSDWVAIIKKTTL